MITSPGTINDLVADAAHAGHQVGTRLIRDWTELGLLDYPQRRPAGKGHGSQAALYPANQRMLFLTLLHHRPTNKIKSLARIPVGIWLYWGDEYVPTSQTRRAMKTWLGDPRSSRRQAAQTAAEILQQVDHPEATAAARDRLTSMVSDIAYTGRTDFADLEHAVRDVFEPGYGRLRRAVGHPDAPMMAQSVVGLIRARLAGIGRLQADDVSDDEFRQARHAHLVAYAEYAAQQQRLAAGAPESTPDMYEPVTAQNTLVKSCGHLLTTIGLATLHPQQAAEIIKTPQPQFRFKVGGA